jgi:hypothetical protein
VALAAIGMGFMAMPALAVQVTFASNDSTHVGPQTGADTLGNTWETINGPMNDNSSFTMADATETPQAFNSQNVSNGLGNFANAFQMTLNSSQNSLGFKGFTLGPVASGLVNDFVVKPSADSSTWVTWAATYSLMDTTGLYQRIRFTAPTGKQLSQGEDFNMNVNFAGIMTNDSGWAASWDDRLALVPPVNTMPEPGSLLLMGVGMMGLIGASRR